MTTTKKSKPKPSSSSGAKKSPKTLTMADLLAKHESNIHSYSRGQKLDAKLVSVDRRHAMFEIDGKSEGVVRDDHFVEARSLIDSLKPGDMVRAVVMDPETRDGYALLSLRHAANDAFWKRINKLYKDGGIMEVVGKLATPHGLMVLIENATGFIPSSQFGANAPHDLDSLVGERVSVKIIDVDEVRGRIVLSEKAVSEADDIARMDTALKEIKKGEVYEGNVSTVVSFGVFVIIEVTIKKGKEEEVVPVEGLVHVSELSWSKIDNPADMFEEGDEVKVVALGTDNGKLALSMKQAADDPWTTLAGKYAPDTKVKGKIVRISDFGAFVEVEPGIEGLVHMTKIAPGTSLKEGQEINCYVEDVNTKERKLSLGIVVTSSKPIGYK